MADCKDPTAEGIKETGYLTDSNLTDGINDLDAGVKKCLAQYLSNLTKGEGTGGKKTANRFPIDNDAETAPEFNDEEGKTVGPLPSNNDASYTTAANAPQLENYSTSKYYVKGTKNLGDFISKGAENKTELTPVVGVLKPWDGHELLKQVAPSLDKDPEAFNSTGASDNFVPSTPTGAVQAYTTQVLAGYNRFDIENNYMNDALVSSSDHEDGYPKSADAEDDHPVASVQKTLGVYKKDSTMLRHNTLRKVGKSLGIRASAETDFSTIDPDSEAARNDALAPGGAQLFNPFEVDPAVDGVELRAYKVLSDLLKIEGLSVADADALMTSNVKINQAASNQQKSIGSMNNYLDIFSGLLPLGMIALHMILALIVFVAVEVLALLFGLLAKPSRVIRNDSGSYVLGKFVGEIEGDGGFGDSLLGGLGDIAQFMGVKPFTFDFMETVTAGFLVYMGVEIPPDLEDFKEFALDAPGYFAVTSRMQVRSIQSISKAFDQINGGSFTDVINSITGIIEAIRDSKIIKMINFYAQLGDKRLSLNATGHEDNVEAGRGFAKISGIDKQSKAILPPKQLDDVVDIKPLTFSKVRLNRTRTNYGTGHYTQKLAWANSTATSMLLLPQPILAAAAVADITKASDASSYGKARDVTVTKAKQAYKISAESRRKMEQWLDAEYVPFYFHDLRTNEIISLHAFLSSLSESFSANYESPEGFGRVDPIRIYQNTERALDLSFWVVATSENDFDVMWAKINKLVTLLYPQWSEGRRIDLAAQKTQIAQPFSQIMTASPLIRLRIGDLIRSNYSRFNLARLFGLGTSLGGGDPTDVEKNVERLKKQQAGEFEENAIVLLRANSDPASSALGTGYRPKEEIPAIQFAVPGFGSPNPQPLPLRISSPTLVQITGNSPFGAGTYYVKPLAGALVEGIKNSAGIGADPLDTSYIAYTSDLIPVTDLPETNEDGSLKQSAQDKLAAEQELLNTINQNGGAGNMFSPLTNPIVRSFEEAGGKGLAGVITSLSFEWTDMPWETDRYGARAPKMCEVSISFAPVHDIAPGIDHYGFNRAPVYNVGEAMNGVAGDADDEIQGGKTRFDVIKGVEELHRNKRR
jgi:hypothetical protein